MGDGGRAERDGTRAQAGANGSANGSGTAAGPAVGNAPGGCSGEPGAEDADGRAAAPEDAPTEADLLDELADEITRLAAHVHAAMARYLGLVADFDRRRGWAPSGHSSCARWLAFRTGLDLRTAREHVRVARALEDLPATRRSMSKGRLSFSQARALTRIATPGTEDDLLALAEGCPTPKLERLVRAWKRGGREDEAARERTLHRSRRLSIVPDDDLGLYAVRGWVTPEVGGVLLRAVEAAEDALYRERRREEQASEDGEAAENGAAPGGGGYSTEHPSSGTPSDPCSTEPPSPRQRRREARRRRADAIGLVAERALAAGFGGGGEGEDGEDAPISGSRAERYQVFLFVDSDTLAAEGEPGRSELEDGTRVSAETSRRLACDVGVVHVNRAADGSVLDVGRRTRTIPPALRRALEVRDRGCRFPGCGLRFTDAHHVTHWADGGETSLENTLLLCRRHHRLVHEEGWTVGWWGKTRAVFTDPRGRHHLDERPPAPELPEEPSPAEALMAENQRRGVDLGPLAAGARWKREADIPDAVLFAALEATLVATEERVGAEP